MSPRTLMAIACAVAGVLGIAIAVNGWFGIEAAVIAMSIAGFALFFAAGIYLLGAALVLITHETWVERLWQRWTQ